MSENLPARDSVAAGDSLPAVEPPSAGFILQLFIVPAVMVIIIVAVWLMFNWLAHMGDDPQSYVDALRRGNVARWQAAVNLANAMRRPNSKLKKDVALATDLSKLLDAELESNVGSPTENDIKLRAYLCKALGEFEIPVGLPTLLKAAGPKSDIQVRRAAIEAIALLASNVGRVQPLRDPQLLPLLLSASSDDESGIREAAAFTLGVLGGPEAIERLRSLLIDGAPNVRYNAATGLARWGDMSSSGVLVEMLDPNPSVGIADETNEMAQEFKRNSIWINALRATSQLTRTAPADADFTQLRQAVERLYEASNVPQSIRIAAQEALLELEPHRPSSSTGKRPY
jgi:HEAT repeat protein